MLEAYGLGTVCAVEESKGKLRITIAQGTLRVHQVLTYACPATIAGASILPQQATVCALFTAQQKVSEVAAGEVADACLDTFGTALPPIGSEVRWADACPPIVRPYDDREARPALCFGDDDDGAV